MAEFNHTRGALMRREYVHALGTLAATCGTELKNKNVRTMGRLRYTRTPSSQLEHNSNNQSHAQMSSSTMIPVPHQANTYILHQNDGSVMSICLKLEVYKTMAAVDVEEQLVADTNGGKVNSLLELREIEEQLNHQLYAVHEVLDEMRRVGKQSLHGLTMLDLQSLHW